MTQATPKRDLLLEDIRTFMATLRFSNGQVETPIVTVLDVDEEGTAYCQLPSGLMTVQRFDSLVEV